MKITRLFIALSITLTTCIPAAAQHIDVAGFLKARGATNAELRQVARSPSPAVVPVTFFEKDNMAPSCGLLVAATGAARSRYIDILGAENGNDFPECIGMPSIRAFRLRGRNYLAIEYLDRDTRDDTRHGFRYVYDDPAQGFVEDKELNDEVPSSDVTKAADGIKLARATMMRKTFPQWQFLKRDFIADDTSAFATFQDAKTQSCHVALEAGADPVSANLAEVAATSRCAGILAATRLSTLVATYYLALFKSDTDKHLVAIASIASDGSVKIEKDLSADINRAGATGDIRTAKAALSKHLSALRNSATRQ